MSYRYLASPYSHEHKSVMTLRHNAAACATVWMLKQKIFVYSPIVHCHELAANFKLPTDADFWIDYNYTMLRHASTISILRIYGLLNSKGVKLELLKGIELDKKVEFIDFTDNGWHSCIITPTDYSDIKQRFGLAID